LSRWGQDNQLVFSRREIRHIDESDDAFEPGFRFNTEFEGAGVDRLTVELYDNQSSHALDSFPCSVRFARFAPSERKSGVSKRLDVRAPFPNQGVMAARRVRDDQLEV